MRNPSVNIPLLAGDVPVSALKDDSWERSGVTVIDKQLNAQETPEGRRTEVRLFGTATALHVRFDARQTEPLVLNEAPQTSVKTMELWERDVCELFLASDTRNRRRYFEFEIAPTGEWLDLIVDWTKDEPRNWEYASGMEAFSKIDPDKVTMVMKIAWTAFGRKPEPGDVWLGNMFRQVGSGDTRGYLAWSPTRTSTPQFHVPEKFGEFIFAR
jgi:hypothetical protein